MLRRFLRNVKYIATHDIQEESNELLYQAALNAETYLRFEYPASTDGLWSPMVLSYDETLSLLESKPKSLVRLGDGEVNLIKGSSIPFQEFDAGLAADLREMVEIYREDVYVGLNYNYFHSTRNMPRYVRRFYLTQARPYRDWLLENCSRARPFWIAAAFNQLYMTYEEYDFGRYYNRIEALFASKRIVVFIGEGTRRKLESNVFRRAGSLEWVDCPTVNAYRDIDEILCKAKACPKDTLLIFCIGPASKSAVWKLSSEGYVAWDLGHLPMDYDAYKRGIARTDEAIIDFTAPDEDPVS